MNAEQLQAEADSLARSLLDLMGRNIWNQATYKDASDKIIALVTRAVREEREECAKACDGQTLKEHDNSTMSIGINAGIQRVKDAIRQRERK